MRFLGGGSGGGQPLDADLTAIAGLSTQPHGRSLLTTTATGTGAARVVARQRGPRIIGLGDSITAGGADSAMGYYDLACVLSGGRLRSVRNAGVSGNTTTQMLARLSTDVIAYAPDWCIVLGGANDIPSTPLATSAANLAAIYETLLDNGIEPIACTVTPRDDVSSTNSARLSTWIRDKAARLGIHCIDFHDLSTRADTGLFLSGFSGDGVHPDRSGQREMAALVVAQLGPHLTAVATPLAKTSADTTNLAGNGLFTANDGSNPTGYGVKVGGSAGVSRTIVADPAGHGSLWQFTMTAVASGTGYGPADITTGFSVGDRIAYSGRILTSGCEAGTGRYQPVLATLTSGGAVTGTFSVFQQACNEIIDGSWYIEVTVPASTGIIRPLFYAVSGTGVVQIGQFTVHNRTTLGLA